MQGRFLNEHRARFVRAGIAVVNECQGFVIFEPFTQIAANSNPVHCGSNGVVHGVAGGDDFIVFSDDVNSLHRFIPPSFDGYIIPF